MTSPLLRAWTWNQAILRSCRSVDMLTTGLRSVHKSLDVPVIIRSSFHIQPTSFGNICAEMKSFATDLTFAQAFWGTVLPAYVGGTGQNREWGCLVRNLEFELKRSTSWHV